MASSIANFLSLDDGLLPKWLFLVCPLTLRDDDISKCQWLIILGYR